MAVVKFREDKFSYLADISPSWQGEFKDDGIDEGYPLDGVIQKTSDGGVNYTVKGKFNHEKWLKQYESIKHMPILLNYHYYRSYVSVQVQLKIMIHNMLNYAYVGTVVDFEAGGNEVSVGEILDLVELVDGLWDALAQPVLVYTNGWIHDFIYDALVMHWGKTRAGAWMRKQIWFVAGGSLYNKKMYALPSPEYDPFPTIPWTGLQFTADKNQMADELDFSEDEEDDLDYNRVRKSPRELYIFFGVQFEEEEESEEQPPQVDIDLLHRVSTLETEVALMKEIVYGNVIGPVVPEPPDPDPAPPPSTNYKAVLVVEQKAVIHFERIGKSELFMKNIFGMREVKKKGDRVNVRLPARRMARKGGGKFDFYELASGFGKYIRVRDVRIL